MQWENLGHVLMCNMNKVGPKGKGRKPRASAAMPPKIMKPGLTLFFPNMKKSN
jgi:hypothetical protein